MLETNRGDSERTRGGGGSSHESMEYEAVEDYDEYAEAEEERYSASSDEEEPFGKEDAAVEDFVDKKLSANEPWVKHFKHLEEFYNNSWNEEERKVLFQCVGKVKHRSLNYIANRIKTKSPTEVGVYLNYLKWASRKLNLKFKRRVLSRSAVHEDEHVHRAPPEDDSMSESSPASSGEEEYYSSENSEEDSHLEEMKRDLIDTEALKKVLSRQSGCDPDEVDVERVRTTVVQLLQEFVRNFVKISVDYTKERRRQKKKKNARLANIRIFPPDIRYIVRYMM